MAAEGRGGQGSEAAPTGGVGHPARGDRRQATRARRRSRRRVAGAAAVMAALVASGGTAAALGALLACGGDAAGPSVTLPSRYRAAPLGVPPAAAPDAPGAAYLDRIAPRFARPWRAFLDDLGSRLPPDHALNQPGLSTVIELDLDADGGLLAVRVTSPSGEPAFDEAAREVVGEAVPLPPPPDELVSDDDHVYLSWRFSRDARQAGAATAAIRRIQWPLDRALPHLLARARIGEAARRVAAEAERAGAAASEPSRAELVARLGAVSAAAVIQAIASDDSARAAIGVAAAVDARLVAAAPELRRLARSTIDPALRRAALRALGQLGDRAAVPLLREVALKEGARAADQSGAAAAALAQLGADAEVRAEAARRLGSGKELERWSALVVMTQLAVPEAAPALVAILAAQGGARPERVMAAEALGAVAARAGAAGGEPAQQALSALTDCLAAPDASLRAACAEAIGSAAAAGARSRAAYDRVARLLGDRDDAARAAATLAAARLDPARFTAAMGRLARERREIVLVALARGLATAPGPRALARLIRLAESQLPPVRLAAAQSLAARAEPRAARALAGLVEHRDPATRAAAMRGLREPEPLRAAIRGDAPEVAAAALAALIALEGRWQALQDAAELLAEQPPASAELAAVARAWLVSENR